MCSVGGTWLANNVDGLRLVGFGLALDRAAVEHDRLLPDGVDGFFSGDFDRLRFLASKFQQGTQHTGIRGFALLQGSEDGVEDVRHFSQKFARLARRLGRGELEHHRQKVGHFALGQVHAGFAVGLRQVDHGRPAVARIAMHMLEQMQ